MSAIGFFDSGMGGLTVLKLARRELPKEKFIYYGDNANAPYGSRDREEILRLTEQGVQALLDQGIKALVIACNTATSVAAPALRQRLDIPVIAMEPALKPAQALRRGGQIIVLATPATLALPRFRQNMNLYGDHAVPVPLRGLVELVEQGVTRGGKVEALLQRALDPVLETPTDAIVLGCTHYPFVRESVRRISGLTVPIIDGGLGTVAQLRRVLQGHGLLKDHGTGEVLFQSSGGEEALRRMLMLYESYRLEEVPAAPLS